MKPDKLDIKIQEAAAHQQTPYSEEAWKAMEKLLDEKMPQNDKNKRKILWILLFFFFIAGALTFLLWNPGQRATSHQPETVTSDRANNLSVSGDRNLLPPNNSDAKSNSNTPIVPPEMKPMTSKKTSSFKPGTMAGLIDSRKGKTEKVTRNMSSISLDKKYESRREEVTAMNHENEMDIQHDESANSLKDANLDSAIGNKFEKTDSITGAKENMEKEKLKNPSVQKPRNHFLNSFMIQLSAGPDVSGVSLDDIGAVRPVYGVGLGYQISKKWAVTSGFFVGRKVYDAKPGDYYPPPEFWNYYPDLNYIDADCLVYDVPISVRYYFNQTPRHQWFGSVGFSSYFMKKEVYDYYSKSSSGQTWYDTHSIENENQHFFSSLRLSAGYEKKIGKNISFIAEPYLNVPVKGVGYGKVKLYSAGVLFSVSLSSFSKK